MARRLTPLCYVAIFSIGCRDSHRTVAERPAIPSPRVASDQVLDGGLIGETYDVGELGLSRKELGDNIGLGPKRPAARRR
jgi:hypothetical protein